MARILIVEDDPAIAELIVTNLRPEGHEVELARNPHSASEVLNGVLPDLVILDWMIAGDAGIALLKRWRDEARTRHLPIIMLSARGQEIDTVAGLDAGADDYITKPFLTSELLARMRGVWGDHVIIEQRTVDVRIKRLRCAMAPACCSDLVETVRGAGCRISAQAQSAAA